MIEIQKAIYSRLKDDSTLDNLLAKYRTFAGTTLSIPAIYTDTPQTKDGAIDAYFPYLTIGEDDHVQFDTDDSNGLNSTILIHSWARTGAKSSIEQIKLIQKAIYNSMHKHDLEIDSAKTINLIQTFSQVIRDEDGKTMHGVQRFQLLTEYL